MTFKKGETLTAKKLNELADKINAVSEVAQSALITDVAGGTFERSRRGTTIGIPLVRPPQKRKKTISSDEATHPFKVSATYADGLVSIQMKGGCWHGNGAGNYLGISYLEKSPDELDAPPESIGTGEDLFMIPDCEATAEISAGEMFAICLYSPDTDGGRLKTYPWAYLKKIESAEKLRNELIEYAFNAVAIVGIWKLSTNADTGTPELIGAPGQMLQSDFFYKNNQIFSTGKFGWSRIDGVKYGFHVSDGLLYVKPNAIAAKTVAGDVLSLKKGEKSETEVEASGLTVSIPRARVSIQTETETAEHVIVKKFEETDNGCEVLKTISVSVPTYEATTSKASISFLSGLTSETEVYTEKISQTKYAFKSETLTATPTSETAWTRVLLIGPVSTATEKQSIQLSERVYSATAGTASFVSNVSLSKTGTETSTATVSVSGKQYVCETEKTEITNLKNISAEVFECENVEYTVNGSVPVNGADFSAAACTDQEKIKKLLGITSDDDGGEAPDLYPFLVSVPGSDFQLADDEIETGIVVALHLSVNDATVSVSWRKINIDGLFDAGTSTKISTALAETPQALALELGLIIGSDAATASESTSDESAESTASETLVGLRASFSGAGMTTYSTTIPIAAIFKEEQTGVPIAQPLAGGCIEVRPQLCIALNTETVAGDTGCENLGDISTDLNDSEDFAETQLKIAGSTEQATAAAFTASAYGLETQDLADVWSGE